MFTLINFGYRSRKLFTIDCLAAALFDCIWSACHRELVDTYNAKDALFAKETETHQAKIESNEKRLEEVNGKLKEEEEAGGDKKVTVLSSRKIRRRGQRKEAKRGRLPLLSSRRNWISKKP